VIGVDLATQLEVEMGAELVLLGQAADGSMANDLYKIVGTADAGTPEMNGGAVFLHLADAQEFFALQGGVHQILVNLEGNPEKISSPLAALRGALDLTTGESLVETMRSLNKEQGITFVFSTHDPMVLDHADRVVKLVDGKIAADERKQA